jgi:hypothetical protein
MPIKELPEDLQNDPALKDFNDLPSLAKSFKETKAFVGSSIRPPGPDAGPEAQKDFLEKLQKHAPNLVPFDDKNEVVMKNVWSRLGVPTDEKEYDFKPPPETGVELDLTALRASAKAAGLTKAQFSKLAELTTSTLAKQRQDAIADSEALKKEWGAAHDDKLKAAAATAEKLGVPADAVKAIAEGKLRSAQLKIWDGIAKAIGTEPNESKRLGGGGGSTKLTPAEANERISEIMNRPDRAYWDANHPQHAELVSKTVELGKFISPD